MEDKARRMFTRGVAVRLKEILRDVQGVQDISTMSSSLFVRMMIRPPAPFPLTVIDLECWRVNLCIRREHGAVGFCVALLAHYFPAEIRLFDRGAKEMPVSCLSLANQQHFLSKLESLGITSVVRVEPSAEMGAWFF